MRSVVRSLLLLGASLFSLGVASGCGNSHDGSAVQTGETSLPSGEVSCQDDSRVDGYVAGLEKPGSLGMLSFRLVESDPAPPAKGSNTFSLQVLDARGGWATADLGVDLIMPDHGHGTSVVPKIAFDPATHSFTIAPLYLFMAGVWRIDFTAYEDAADPSTKLDQVSFFFCVEG